MLIASVVWSSVAISNFCKMVLLVVALLYEGAFSPYSYSLAMTCDIHQGIHSLVFTFIAKLNVKGFSNVLYVREVRIFINAGNSQSRNLKAYLNKQRKIQPSLFPCFWGFFFFQVLLKSDRFFWDFPTVSQQKDTKENEKMEGIAWRRPWTKRHRYTSSNSKLVLRKVIIKV